MARSAHHDLPADKNEAFDRKNIALDWIANAFRNRLFASVSAILDAARDMADGVVTSYSGGRVPLESIDLGDLYNGDFSLITP